jgi:hypothetical protein
VSTDSGRLAGISAAIFCADVGSDADEGDAEGRLTPIVGLLDALFEEVLLIGGAPPLSVRGRRVADPPGPASPLRGLLAALDAAREERVLAVASDRAGLSPDLVLALVAAPDSQAVVVRTDRGVEPLVALYRRDPVRDLARARLGEGRLALHALLAELDVWHLEGDDLECVAPGGRAFARGSRS